MKIWNGYGSEHSMNLVMIGRFSEAKDAEEARELIEELTKIVNLDEEDQNSSNNRYSERMMDFFKSTNMYTIKPEELEQFIYDVRTEVENDKVVITTDESEISAFMKVLLEKGARIEMYSAHDYPDTGLGR